MKRDNLTIYSMGLCCASICASKELTREEIEDGLNLAAPTGITSQWAISDDPTFADGQPNPCQCEADPDRQHWLANC